ncbi:MAG: PD40 domain-containing protein [Caldilineaceae bacterium]|nr:PD40 domain-containing protein [Caldilineaceae bacterium]
MIKIRLTYGLTSLLLLFLATFHSVRGTLVAQPVLQQDVYLPLIIFPPNVVTLISATPDGRQGNNDSLGPVISSDGRYIAFVSLATDLVSDDTNRARDIFVYDRQLGQITRVPSALSGVQGDGSSDAPALSGDGRLVAFMSQATNLVPNDTNNQADIFVFDRRTGEIERISLAVDGTQGNKSSRVPDISDDGRLVAFESRATNLVTDDTNEETDIFVYDRQSGEIERVSISTDGVQADKSSLFPAISPDGRYVSFTSHATNLVDDDTNEAGDIFVHDRVTGETRRVSIASDGTQSNSWSGSSSISVGGQLVAFLSNASNLVADDTNSKDDIFVHDLKTGETVRVSISSDGIQADRESWSPSLAAQGRYVTFTSSASNLVTDDIRGDDIFVHDLLMYTTTSVSGIGFDIPADAYFLGAWMSSISANGSYVAFTSDLSLPEGDSAYAFRNVFVRTFVETDGSTQ